MIVTAVGAFSVPAINVTMTVGHNFFDCDCVELTQIAIFHWIVSVLMQFFFSRKKTNNLP
jgi:hypothetical protein